MRAAGRSIAIVANNGPGATGGLATYLRKLGEELDRHFSVSSIVRFDSGAAGLSYDRSDPPGPRADGPVPVEVIGARRGWGPSLRAARRLVHRPSTQSVAVAIVHGGWSKPIRDHLPDDLGVVLSIGAGWELLGFAALREARRRGAAFAVTPAIHPGTWGDSTLDGRLYREADAVFALSEYERDRLLALGVARDRVTVTGLGPATPPSGDGAAFRARHGLGARPLVLFIGRKQRYKGFHATCSAVAQVRESVPECCLVAVGPPGEPPYPSMPDGSLLDLDVVTDAEKADALDACDVVCMPSEGEAFGIVYVEAWSAGKPVVAGTAPAVRELIREGVDGFCVRQDGPELAERLRMLLLEPGLRARMGAAGRQRQRAEYHWPVVAERHRAVFERLMD